MVHVNPKCMQYHNNVTHVHGNNMYGSDLSILWLFVGHLDIVTLLVEKYGAEIAEKQDNRLTKPIFFAAQEGMYIIPI